MADFLQDYSNLGAAGSAFEGFAKGYSDAQDRKMKQLEMQAQTEALKSKMQRDQDTDQLNAIKEGYTKNASGQFEEAPLSPRQRSANQLKMFGEGAQATGFDENGNPTGYKADPKSVAYLKAQTAAQIGLNRNERADENINIRKDTQDRREHERVLTRLNANPQARQKLGQYLGLDNALSIITEADHLTPETIHEFQQTLRSNMGMKGQGGVGEREETYFKSLSLNAARMGEFLTGDPATLAKDQAFVTHLKQMAEIEKKNISNQFDRSLNAASSGHGSMYRRRDDLKQDLMDAISAQKDQMQVPPQSVPPQGGLVKPEQEGLLSRLGGLVMGSKAQANQKPTTIKQNGITYTLNPQTGEYE